MIRIFLTLVVVCGFLFGSEVDNINRYSVDELIDLTIKTHPNIQASKQAIIGAQAGVKGAWWNYFPTPKVSSQYTKDRFGGATLSLEQPLWTGGKLDSGMEMAQANEKDAQFALEENGYNLVESLLNAIKTYQNAQGTLDALYEGQKQLQILEGMLSRRIAAGVSAKADMDLLKARLYQMDTDISLANMRRQTSLSQIELLTGKRFGQILLLKNSSPHIEKSLDEILQNMYKTHPTLARYDVRIEYAKAEKKKAKAALWPNIVAVVQKNYGSSSVYEDLKQNDTAAYLSLQATPGAGLSSISNIEASQAKIMQLEQEKISKQQELTEKAMMIYNDYISALRRVDVQSQSIGSAQKVFASYTRLFLAGKRQWLDLVNASRELTQNEIAFSDIKSTLAISAYQIKLLCGELKALQNLHSIKQDKQAKEIKEIKEIKIDPLTRLKDQSIPSNNPSFDSIMNGEIKVDIVDENITKLKNRR